MNSNIMSFVKKFTSIAYHNNLCPKHMREVLGMFDSWPDRKFDICYRIVVDNENCRKCHENAESAYYSKLMEERNK